jgi:hypothetical protein
LKGSLTGSTSNMSEAERAEFSQEIAIFVTTFASEVRELRQTIRSAGNDANEKNPKNKTISGDDSSSSSKEEIIHKNDIASYLLEVRTLLYMPPPLQRFSSVNTHKADKFCTRVISYVIYRQL